MAPRLKSLTEVEEALVAVRWSRVGDSSPNGSDVGGGTTNEGCTSVNGRDGRGARSDLNRLTLNSNS